jgi:hypothetical protein
VETLNARIDSSNQEILLNQENHAKTDARLTDVTFHPNPAIGFIFDKSVNQQYPRLTNNNETEGY